MPGPYSVGHTRIFTETLQLSTEPLGHGDAGQVYKGTSRSGFEYCVKLFRPYLPEHMEWDRSLLSQQQIRVADAELNTYFNLWHRESRAYERVDRFVDEPMRSFFPKYHGTLELAYPACPKAWRCAYPEHGKVGAIVLELLSESRPWPTLPSPSSYRSVLLPKARRLYWDLGDVEYVHIFIHLSEIVESLHDVGIIHSDVQGANIIRSVLFDFSKSWLFTEGGPFINQRRTKTLEERRESVLGGIYKMVRRECRGEAEHSLRTKFPAVAECVRYEELIFDTSSASLEVGIVPRKLHSGSLDGSSESSIIEA